MGNWQLSSVLDFLHIEVGEVSSALAFGLLLALGLFGGRLAKRFGLPAITGYLVFGILLNPYVTNRIDPSHHYFNPEIIEQLVDLIEIIALSYIAYIIGGSLRLDTLRGLGKRISSVTLIQGAVPFLFVFLLVAFVGPFVAPPDMLVGSNSYLALGLVAGSISLATAPAATIAVLHEVKARGPMTTTILGVVALDDALAVVAFILMAGVATAILQGGVDSVSQLLLSPVIHLVLSVLLGVVFGYLLIYVSRFFRGQRGTMTLVVLGTVVLCGGIAEMLGFEYILTCMAFGFVVVNQMKSTRLIDMALSMEDMVFVAFFAVVGANFDFDQLGVATIIGSLLLIARFAGKYLGAWLGATAAKSPPNVRKWLGITLLPQAGVSIGLATSAANMPGLASIGTLLMSSIFVAVIITEIIAPPLVRIAVMRSGEGHAV